MSLSQVIEFKMDQDPLLSMIRNEFKMRGRMLCADEFTIDVNGQQKILLLDHIEIPDGGTIQRSPNTTSVSINPGSSIAVQLVEVAVPFQVFLKTKECIYDPACAPDEYEYKAVQYTLVLTLTAEGGQICMNFARVDPGPIAPSLPPEAVGLIQGAIAQVCSPFDLDPLEDLLGTQVSIKNAGISTNPSLTRIALRLEFNEFSSSDADSLAAWQEFFADPGQIGPHIVGKDWCLLIGHKLFTDSLIAKFAESLSEKKDKFELDSDTPLSAEWSAGGAYGGGHATVTFSGQLHDTLCPNDIGLHPVTVNLDLHVDASDPGVIQSEGTIAWEAVDSDVALCSITLGIGLAAISPDINFGVMMLGGLIAGSAEPDEEDLNLPSECTAKSGTEFHCTQGVSLPSIHIGSQGALLDLQTMSGSADGPLLGGSVGVHPYNPGPLLSVSASKIELGILRDNSSCSSLHIGYSGNVILSGYPGSICEVAVLDIDDPLHVFTVLQKDGSLPADVEIRFADGMDVLAPDFLQQYWNWQPAPYPCKLLIRTGAGARSILIKAPAKGDPSSLPDDLLFARIMCKVSGLLEQTGLLGIPGKFDPHWHVDPPWEVLVQIVGIDGGSHIVRAVAQWTNIRVNAAGLTEGSIAQTGGLVFTGAPLRLQGDVLVDTGRFGRFEVSLDELVVGDLSGRVLNKRGKVDLMLASSVKMGMKVPQDELPRGTRAILLIIHMDPGSLRLTGQLRQLAETAADRSRSRIMILPSSARG